MNVLNLNFTPLRFLLLFIIIMLAQVLICNHILLFGVAFPIIFIYFLMLLPMNVSVNLLLTLAFLTGLTYDIFSDTPGLNTLCCVILAIMRKPVFYAYVPKEEKYRDVEPSISTLGWENYLKYLLTLATGYCLLYFCLDFLSFNTIRQVLVMTVCSTLLSAILILGIDAIVMTKKENS